MGSELVVGARREVPKQSLGAGVSLALLPFSVVFPPRSLLLALENDVRYPQVGLWTLIPLLRADHALIGES